MINPTKLMSSRSHRHGMLDHGCCMRVAQLARSTPESVGVVITSTWRLTHSLDQIDGIFRRNGLRLNIVGKTPDSTKFLSRSRGLEIKQYLSKHDTRGYVILDDDEFDIRDHFPEHRFVHVDHFHGFSDAHYPKASMAINVDFDPDELKTIDEVNNGQ